MSRKSKTPEFEVVSAEPEIDAKPITNAQAVRDAIADGCDTLDEIDEFVQSRYGKVISRQQLSAYKSQTRRKAGEPPSGRGRKPRVLVEGYLAPPPRRSTAGGQEDLLDALQHLKPLVADMGADRVKKLVDLLS